MKKEIQGIVEIGSKPVVERKATATGLLHLQQEPKQAKKRLESYRIVIQYLSRDAKLTGRGRERPFVVLFMFLLITKPVSKWKH